MSTQIQQRLNLDYVCQERNYCDSKDLLTKIYFRNTFVFMNTPQKNEVSIVQLEAFVKALRFAADAAEKCIVTMQKKKITTVLTTNWDSSGEGASMLIKRFVDGLPGAIESHDVEDVFRAIVGKNDKADEVVRTKRQAKNPKG